MREYGIHHTKEDMWNEEEEKDMHVPRKYMEQVKWPQMSQTFYCVISRVINKSRAPKVPLLFVNNSFILDCETKLSILCIFHATLQTCNK